jgi:hypothetical protein
MEYGTMVLVRNTYLEADQVRLTYEQCQFIQKLYIKFLCGKTTLEKMNEKMQKHFNVTIDFKQVISECKEMNKGYYDITWKFLEVQ